MGRMATVSDGVDSVAYTYNANGNLTKQTNGNIKTYYEYNKAGLLSVLTNKHETSSSTKELSSFTYTYRADGNISGVKDARVNEGTRGDGSPVL